MDAVITQKHAEEIARSIRDEALRDYANGRLSRFVRGQYQGQLVIVSVYMHPSKWVMQGIRNEVDFFCARAIDGGQQ